MRKKTYAIAAIVFFVAVSSPVPWTAPLYSMDNPESATITRSADSTVEIPTSAQHDSTLFETIRKGGPVMIPIIFCGILALTMVIERLLFFTRRGIWKASSLPVYLSTAAKISGARYREEKSDDLREAFQNYMNDMERGMTLLQGLGNLAPLLGFLGTVTGMISAFAAIAAATTVNARIVAVGIQEALITTAGGLIVAAPATFFYYLFLHVIQQRHTQAEGIIESLCRDMPRLSDELEAAELVEEY